MNRLITTFFVALVYIGTAQAEGTYADAARYSNAANSALSRAYFYSVYWLYQKAYLSFTGGYYKYQAYLAGTDARNQAKHAYEAANLAYSKYGWTYHGYYARYYAYKAYLHASLAVPQLWHVYSGIDYEREANVNLHAASLYNGHAAYFLGYAITPETP